MNAAFAVELYLKALNRLYDNDVGRTHDLLQLFSALPDAAKQAISLEFDRATSRPSTMTNLSAFQAEIERVRHAFMDWRYLHERTRTDEVRIQELIFVLNVLHNVLRFDARVNPNASDQV